jgi:hypothetical protein
MTCEKDTRRNPSQSVIMDGKISNRFVISVGVRQGDVLSATLFNLIIHKALKKKPGTKENEFWTN